MELAPLGATTNAILAGVTDTPALRKIPGNEQMIEVATKKNPHGRLTTTQDVAKAIAVFSHENSGTADPKTSTKKKLDSLFSPERVKIDPGGQKPPTPANGHT